MPLGSAKYSHNKRKASKDSKQEIGAASPVANATSSKGGAPARSSSGSNTSTGSTPGKTAAAKSGTPKGYSAKSKGGQHVQVIEPSTPSSTAAKRQSLTASSAVEEFIDSGLLSEASDLLQVQATESVASVVEKLRLRRLRSCIVLTNSAGTRREFFDCCDLHCFLLEALATGGDGGTGGVEPDTESVREKLRSVGAASVGSALRSPRGMFAFTVFDARESLEQLIMQFKTLRRVPVFRGGKFVRVVTASDILEICCVLSEDTRSILERAKLTEVLAVLPSALCDLQVPEEDTTLEVLRMLRKSDTGVAMVMDSHRGSDLEGQANDAAARLASQFDIASLRILFTGKDGKNKSDDRSGTKDGNEEPRSPGKQQKHQWWWEENSESNFLLEPCMDFLAVVPSLQATSEATAPYNTIPLEESIARAISRLMTSSYRSIVVQRSGGSRAGRSGYQGAARGILTTRSLVTALIEAHVFQNLRFDVDINMRLDSTCSAARRKSSHSRISLCQPNAAAVVQPQHEPRRGRVTFSTFVEVDRLLVPVCVDHSVHCMEYAMMDRSILDFRDIMDLIAEGTASGAVATCTGCEETIGTITLRPNSPAPVESRNSATTITTATSAPSVGRDPSANSFFESFSSILGDKAAKDGAGGGSALKNGLKSRAPTGKLRDPGEGSGGGMFLCCTTCNSVSAKEQISAVGQGRRAPGNNNSRGR